MKLSARNMLKGKVKGVTKGTVAAEIEVDVGNGNVITSTITVGSANRLGLVEGKDVHVIIKASEVILGVEEWSARHGRRHTELQAKSCGCSLR